MADTTRANGSRWGRRTIREGAVRWCGRTYRVTTRTEADLNGFWEPAYEGQLDGMRALFYKYPTGTLDDLLTLHSFEDQPIEQEPNVTASGHIIWTDWRAEGGQSEVSDTSEGSE